MADRWEFDRLRGCVYAILLASAFIRIPLVWASGHNYWPDEGLYRGFTAAVARGDVPAALDTLRDDGHHLAYRIVWIIPDALEYAADSERISTYFFGLVYVVNIWLVWRIARRGGASDVEAAIAAALVAASNSIFYYARHFFPYDLALMLGLAAVFVGIRPSPHATRSIACGALAGATFVMYPGYWTVAAAAIAIHLAHSGSWRSAPARALLAAVGSLLTFAAAHAAFAGLTGRSLFESFTGYAGTIRQGVFEEGWRLPVEYLWHAEHGYLVLWASAVAASLWRLRSGRVPPLVRLCLLAIVLIYGALAVSSVVLQWAVVYGRLARQLVPFLCLITAHEIARIRSARTQLSQPVLAALTLCALAQTGVNFWQPLQLAFPQGFRNESSPLVAGLPPEEYTWANVRHIYPGPDPVSLPAGAIVLAEAPHPLQFLPYQYEGYTPEEREALRSSDLQMRLILLPREHPGRGQAPGAFPPSRRPGPHLTPAR